MGFVPYAAHNLALNAAQGTVQRRAHSDFREE
jgi:hypothetical protein